MERTIDTAIAEWSSKNRRMGCVSASQWFCHRVEGFYPVRLDRGDWEHVVATNGQVVIDLVPHLDSPEEEIPQ